MYAGGLDIGTSGCKIVLYDKDGHSVRTEYEEYNVDRKNGHHEIDPEEIFTCVKKVIGRLNEPNLISIGVTGFGETFVMLDENDKPCAPSMLYTDPRGKEECDDISKHFGAENLAYLTGAAPTRCTRFPK